MKTEDYIIMAVAGLIMGVFTQSWLGLAGGVLSGFLSCAAHKLLLGDR